MPDCGHDSVSFESLEAGNLNIVSFEMGGRSARNEPRLENEHESESNARGRKTSVSAIVFSYHEVNKAQ